ncbi:MAG TPA: hypothetical protein VM784_06865 [Actinomycetota bacterium]|nr:hypothetical protein [Actinomycetota bacterium]
MILDVAGEAVDLVDHDRTDVALRDAYEHGFQVGTVGASRRLAGVEELVGDVPALLGAVL